MANKLNNLKYAIFNEWSYDSPAGEIIVYYDARGTTYKDLLWPVSEIYDHFSCLLEDSDEEAAEEFEEVCNSVKASKKSIENFNWENGGMGCGCDFIAEGKEIAQKAADFYQSKLANWYAWINNRKTELAEHEKIVKDALDNPGDYDAVIRLLDMISEIIEVKNDAAMG